MPPIQLSPIASAVLIGFYILGSLTLVILLAGVAYLLYKANRLLEDYRAKIDPALERANQVLDITARRVDSIGGKAERILAQGEEITDNVQRRVEKTASTVQKTVNAPLIGVNSLAAGIGKAAATFTRLQNREKRPARIPVVTAIAPPVARAVAEPVTRLDNPNETERIPAGVVLSEKEYRNGGQ